MSSRSGPTELWGSSAHSGVPRPFECVHTAALIRSVCLVCQSWGEEHITNKNTSYFSVCTLNKLRVC